MVLALFSFFSWQCLKSTRPGIPESVRKTIVSSDINGPEFMKAIIHYSIPEDSNKLKALYWLIANMDGNYTVQYSVQDSLGHQYHFPPAKYKNYNALEDNWDSVENVVGTLSCRADSFWVDKNQLSAAFLIQNVDEAYKAYTTNPRSKSYDFAQFCRWILPYRCANETVEPFRKHLIDEYGSEMKNSHDLHIIDIALLLNKLINQKIHYKDSYNKEVNVQTISQLEHSGYGNFYDINIYKIKVLRSFGIAASLDYIPFLADTSFGYAWTTVLLPDNSELRLEFPTKVKKLDNPGRVAKVYRRTYEKIKTSLFAQKDIHETTPPFLGDYYYLDITNELSSETVSISCNKKTDYAYLAVFNDGDWHPISWGIPSKDSIVTFQRMGTNIVYLPVRLEKHRLFWVSAPFILGKQGIQHSLIPDFSSKQNVLLKSTGPYQKLVQGISYTLYVWEGNWTPLFSFIGSKKGISAQLPDNGLFLLTDNELPLQERIFVVGSKGNQVFY